MAYSFGYGSGYNPTQVNKSKAFKMDYYLLFMAESQNFLDPVLTKPES